MLHVWNICLHLGNFWGKCRYIFQHHGAYGTEETAERQPQKGAEMEHQTPMGFARLAGNLPNWACLWETRGAPDSTNGYPLVNIQKTIENGHL